MALTYKCVCTHVHSFTTTSIPEVTSAVKFQHRGSQRLHLNVLTVLRGYLGLVLVYTLHIDVWEQRASECVSV